MTAAGVLQGPSTAGDAEALPHCGPALLLQRAARRGGAVALRHKDLGIWRETSWAEYATRVAVQARALAALGVQRGDRVAILADNRPEWVVADLAAQSLGAITVGLYSTSPAAEVEYLLAHSGAVLCVVEDEEQWDKVRTVRASLPELRQVVVLETRGVHALGEDPLLLSIDDFDRLGAGATRDELSDRVAAIDPSAVAILVYTSGTTGPPKGAMITHTNLMTAAEALSSAMAWRKGRRCCPTCRCATSSSASCPRCSRCARR